MRELVAFLYWQMPEPTERVHYADKPLTHRNDHIKLLYAEGHTLEDIAAMYAISKQRVHQIIHGRKNRKQ